ncbi:MAG: response regulator transcription factor [Syntrophales bacterium]|jgi:DNA-binding NarL/FixJ family response regulator|nr:response regulator transcription factor [Syntrophales bacterium]
MANILLGASNRAVIKRWLGLLPKNTKTDTAMTLSDFLQKCVSKNHDLVIVHRSFIDVKAFMELRKLTPMLKYFLLSDEPNEEEGLAFLKLGIVGYGNTYISPNRMAEAIRVVSGGGVWLGQKVIQFLIQETYNRTKRGSSEKKERTSLDGLTRAEWRIAEMVAMGRSNLEIAADLGITERTVKAHLTSIYEKTKTGSRLNLALLINKLE